MGLWRCTPVLGREMPDAWAGGQSPHTLKSALWDLKTGDVLYADGIHTEASIRAPGGGLNILNGCEGTEVMFLLMAACAETETTATTAAARIHGRIPCQATMAQSRPQRAKPMGNSR